MLTTGLLFVFSLVIVGYLVKLIIFDILVSFFRPLTTILGWSDFLTVPVAILIMLVLVLSAGFVLSRVRIRKLADKIMNWATPKGIEKKRAALVKLGPEGISFFGAITKEIELKKDGRIKKQYVLFCPQAPIPLTGLPIIVAGEELVTPLDLSYGELYGIISSLGMNTPKFIKELEKKLKSTEV